MSDSLVDLLRDYAMMPTAPSMLILEAAAALESLQAQNGQLMADLMGCRDGALVRDLQAENERLKQEQCELCDMPLSKMAWLVCFECYSSLSREYLAFRAQATPVHQPSASSDARKPEETRTAAAAEHHGLDTPERVCFYEQDFYVLSNFSAFNLYWRGLHFDTSEAAYQWSKFDHEIDSTASMLSASIRIAIHAAGSAHEAFKLAEANRHLRRVDWGRIKVGVMRNILCAKVRQHEYVRQKLLATGERELVENSWRDDFWGWGPNRDGQNMLGKLWMEVRAALRDTAPVGTKGDEN